MRRLWGLRWWMMGLLMAGSVMFLLALAPGLPLLPFTLLGGILMFVAYIVPRRKAEALAIEDARARQAADAAADEVRQSVNESLKTAEIELCLGKQISSADDMIELFLRQFRIHWERQNQFRNVFGDREFADFVAEVLVNLL